MTISKIMEFDYFFITMVIKDNGIEYGKCGFEVELAIACYSLFN